MDREIHSIHATNIHLGACRVQTVNVLCAHFADDPGIVRLPAAPTVAQDGQTPLPQTRAAEPTPTATPTRSAPFAATPDGPLIFDFPTPRAVGSPGPISGQELSALEKSALAVVKLNGCNEAGVTTCTASDGSGIIIHPRGLILTALHVVVEDRNDLQSAPLPEVSIGMVTDVDALSAASTYRASVIAIDPDLDIALLWINQTADQSQLHLPTLPVERVTIRELRRASLQVLGFPQGRSSLKEPLVDFYGAQDGVEFQAESASPLQADW